MSDGQMKQVQGVCEGILERGDWLEFHINIGRQYPVKLSTKKEEIKTIARLAGQQMAVWTFNETEGGPNPHRPGENFKNRYLSNVVVGGALDPALAGNQPGQTSLAVAPTGGAAPMIGPDERGQSIERQVILKAAISVFPGGTIVTEDQWFALITRLDSWLAAPRTTQATVEAPPAAAETTPFQNADDDIPF